MNSSLIPVVKKGIVELSEGDTVSWQWNFACHQVSKQDMKRLLLLAVTVALTACARPGDHPVSSNCAWIENDNRPLNLMNMTDRRHLHFDAVTAEVAGPISA